MKPLTTEQKLRKIIRKEITALNEGTNTIDPKILKIANLILIWTEWLVDKNRNNNNGHVTEYVNKVDDALDEMINELEKIK